jgi:CheY-like chemotaxis protein
VRELLFNAVKHSGVSEADVELLRTADDAVKITVRDAGVGFDPDLLHRRSSAEPTFGLFSIQQRLVHIGGKMDIDAAPGKGARITLTAPIGPIYLGPAETITPRFHISLGETITIRPSPHSCRVLVVDDHRIVRGGLRELLQLEPDIEVVGEAADGPQAIELAAGLAPDVIIMDVNLGEMSGVEATRKILAGNPDIKIIALSMYTDRNIVNAMRDAGAVAYLTKGGPTEDLLSAIRACSKAQ